MTQRATYRRRARIRMSVTVSPRSAAFACAARHRSSGTRNVRRMLATSYRPDTRAGTSGGTGDGVRVVRHVDQPVTPRCGARHRRQCGWDLGGQRQRQPQAGGVVLADLALALDPCHAMTVYTSVYTRQGGEQ